MDPSGLLGTTPLGGGWGPIFSCAQPHSGIWSEQGQGQGCLQGQPMSQGAVWLPCCRAQSGSGGGAPGGPVQCTVRARCSHSMAPRGQCSMKVIQGGGGQQLVLQRRVTWMGRQRTTCSSGALRHTRARAGPLTRAHRLGHDRACAFRGGAAQALRLLPRHVGKRTRLWGAGSGASRGWELDAKRRGWNACSSESRAGIKTP